MAPPPPRPLIHGSSTPKANVVAIRASMQSPPAASRPAPTSAALRDCAATMPPFEVTAGLRICWVLENWSFMACLGVSYWLGRLAEHAKSGTLRAVQKSAQGEQNGRGDANQRW